LTFPLSPSSSDDLDNKTESEGSYEFDEEIALASESNSSFDFPLPDTLLSEQQKHNRVIQVDDYDKDNRNPMDRWSPSPVMDQTPEAPKHLLITSFTNAPKRPIRQHSIKHNLVQDDDAEPLHIKNNLLQERQELMQQMKRVDNLLQGLIHENADQQVTSRADSKTAEETTEVYVQPPLQPLYKDHTQETLDDGTDDDSSTYSMLSGIMASWMAERDAATLKSSCQMATPSAATKSRLSVRFDRIHVREYERVVGDNPSCSSGRKYIVYLRRVHL
jgi:hypothetical protein